MYMSLPEQKEKMYRTLHFYKEMHMMRNFLQNALQKDIGM